MSRIILIQAAPTPWDVEDRLVGNHPLPLTELAIATIESLARNLPKDVATVHAFKKNEASLQAARIVAEAVAVKATDNRHLDEINLGLWQGLTRAELRFRHPTVFPQWEQNPLSVNPPDGETLLSAIQRVAGALKRIIKRRRTDSMVLVLRPFVMQIALGVLGGEEPPAIAGHLHKSSPMETIEPTHEQ